MFCLGVQPRQCTHYAPNLNTEQISPMGYCHPIVEPITNTYAYAQNEDST